MRFAIISAIVMLAAYDARAQEQIQIIREAGDQIQLPGAGPRQQFKTGTGRIRGRVLSSETGGPLRRAQVRIGGADVAPKTALTDVDGTYEFRDLPAGRFTVTASKTGYVSIQYGQTRPFESGRPIELAEKQVLEKADITMPRGGVIAGRIVDEFGEPMPDVTVNALRQRWIGGRRRLGPAGGRSATTNDLGQFRLYGLPPGDYYVSATFRSSVDMFNVEGLVGAGGTAIYSTGGTTTTSGYAPTYFPGSANAAEAQKITVAAGQETPSADFALLPAKLAKVSGFALNAEGKPLEGAMVTLFPLTRNEMGLITNAGNARTTRDGAFAISGVAPGEYSLQVRPMQMVTRSEPGNAGGSMIRTMISDVVGSDAEYASVPVTVAGEDVANMIVVTAKGGTATGRVTFEGGTSPPSAGVVRITASPVDVDGPTMMGGGSATVQEDGTFELKGLTGARVIRASAPGWTLKTVRLNGTEITDTSTEFKPGNAVSGLEVVLTSHLTTISGGVTGSNGAPVKDCTVVIFSENAELWRSSLSRWVTGTRPNQDGLYTVKNMPAGSYYAIALEYVAQGEWADPELLERLKSKATRFDLGEGETRTLDLKLVTNY